MDSSVFNLFELIGSSAYDDTLLITKISELNTKTLLKFLETTFEVNADFVAAQSLSFDSYVYQSAETKVELNALGFAILTQREQLLEALVQLATNIPEKPVIKISRTLSAAGQEDLQLNAEYYAYDMAVASKASKAILEISLAANQTPNLLTPDNCFFHLRTLPGFEMSFCPPESFQSDDTTTYIQEQLKRGIPGAVIAEALRDHQVKQLLEIGPIQSLKDLEQFKKATAASSSSKLKV